MAARAFGAAYASWSVDSACDTTASQTSVRVCEHAIVMPVQPHDASSKQSQDSLRDIVSRGFESRDLDYKQPLTWDESNKKTCCDLVKDILGMANTLGGYIVIGVAETPTGFQWTGLTTPEAESFDVSRLNRFLQNYCDPPVETLVKKVNVGERLFVVIEVPRFADTPHICQRDYPGALTAPTLYVRTASAETAPVRSSSDFRALVEHAIRNRVDLMTATLTAILRGPAPSSEATLRSFDRQYGEAVDEWERVNKLSREQFVGIRQISCHPQQFFGDALSLESVRMAVERAHVSFRGWPYLFSSERDTHPLQDGLQTAIPFKDFAGHQRLDFWRVHQSGFFFHRRLMWEDSYRLQHGGPAVLDVSTTYVEIGEGIDCIARLYDGVIDDADALHVEVAFFGIQDRMLKVIESGRPPLFVEYCARIPELRCQYSHTLAEWRSARLDLAVKIAQDVFQRFGWWEPNVGVGRQLLSDLFKRRQ